MMLPPRPKDKDEPESQPPDSSFGSSFGHCGEITAIAICGRFVVTGGVDATVRVWDRSTGHLVTVLRNHKGSVLALASHGHLVGGGEGDSTACCSVLAESRGNGGVESAVKGCPRQRGRQPLGSPLPLPPPSPRPTPRARKAIALPLHSLPPGSMCRFDQCSAAPPLGGSLLNPSLPPLFVCR